jgi:hypothetical protein
VPQAEQPGLSSIISMNSKHMLSAWDIISDVLLLITIFQNVGPASWMPWISIFAILCGLIVELFMTYHQISEFKNVTEEDLTELKEKFNFAFFVILLLEDLP